MNWPFKQRAEGAFFPHNPLSKHCWLYYQEGVEINDSGDSGSSQPITTTFHRQAQAGWVPRSARTRWLLYSWEAALGADDEYLWPALGSYRLKITCLPDPPLLLGTVLSSGLREKSIWHSAMQSIFLAHFIMINEVVWMVLKVCVWQGTCVLYWFIIFSRATWLLPGFIYMEMSFAIKWRAVFICCMSRSPATHPEPNMRPG